MDSERVHKYYFARSFCLESKLEPSLLDWPKTYFGPRPPKEVAEWGFDIRVFTQTPDNTSRPMSNDQASIYGSFPTLGEPNIDPSIL